MSTKMVLSDPNSSSGTSTFHPAFMVNNIQIAIPVVLDYGKVLDWVELFETHLCAYNLLDHIDSTVPRPTDVSASLWKRLDALVKQWIYATISPDILVTILCRKSTAQQIWNRLQEIFQVEISSHGMYLGPTATAAAAVTTTATASVTTTGAAAVTAPAAAAAAVVPSNAGSGGNVGRDDQQRIACPQQQQQQGHKRKKSNTRNVKDGDESANVELIRTLPEDMLVSILPFLDLKTANKTCILSKRWRYAWTYLTHLDIVHDPKMKKRVFDAWVNQVISSNRAPHLDTFRIHAPHKEFQSADVEKWFLFALSKNVRNLELNLLGCNQYFNYSNIVYKNPKLLGVNAVNNTLECLHLECVSTGKNLLKWILSNCHNLRRLSIDLCEYKRHRQDNHYHIDAEKDQVVVSSEKLKQLELYHCRRDGNKQEGPRSFDALHINAPNLTSFILFDVEYTNIKYKNRNLFDVEYANVPSLVDACFGGIYSAHILRNMDILSGLFSQLEKLSLLWDEVLSSTTVFPTFENVKHLEIAIRYDYGDVTKMNLLSSIFLIKACPLLHTLKFKVEDRQPLWVAKIKNRQASAIPSTHENLKVVEFAGFDGCNASVEVSHYLLQYPPVLEKFIFDLRPACSESQRKSHPFRHPDEEILSKRHKIAKARSAIKSMLKAFSREGLDVVIIEE